MGMIARGLLGPAAIAALLGVARDIAGAAPLAPAETAPQPGPAEPPQLTRYDRFMDGVNRVPRPMLAFGTLAMFTYSMLEPEQFATRMAGLKEVPEPMWWLLGGIVGFYFGAREAHYFRARGTPPPATTAPPAETNPALEDWKAGTPD